MKKLLATLMVLLGVHAWSADVVVTNMAGLPAVDASAQPNDLFMFYDVDNPGARTRKLTVQQLGDTLLNLDIISRGVAVAPGANTTVGTNKVGWTTVYTVNSTGGAGSTALSNLTDVDVTGVVSGNALVYDGTDWVPGSPSAAGSIPTNGGTGFNNTFVAAAIPTTDMLSLTNQPRLMTLGDSVMDYAQSSQNPPFYAQIALSNSVAVDNWGISGTTASNAPYLLTNYFLSAIQAKSNTWRSVSENWGVNSADNSNETGAAASNGLRQVYLALRAVGVDRIIALSAQGSTSSVNQSTITFINAAKSNMVVEGLADMYLDQTSATNYMAVDGKHPDSTGSRYIGTNLAANVGSFPVMIPRVGQSWIGGYFAPQRANGVALGWQGWAQGRWLRLLSSSQPTNIFAQWTEFGLFNNAPLYQNGYPLSFYLGNANSLGTLWGDVGLVTSSTTTNTYIRATKQLEIRAGGKITAIFTNTDLSMTNSGAAIRLGVPGPSEYAVSALGTYNPAPDYYKQTFGPTFFDASSNVVFGLSYDGTKLQLSSATNTQFGIYNWSGGRTNIEFAGGGMTRLMLSTNTPFATNGTVRSMFGVDSAGQVVETAVLTGGGGSATNAIGSTFTNNVAVGTGQTELGLTNGSATTVQGYTTGARTIYSVNVSTALANLNANTANTVTNVSAGWGVQGSISGGVLTFNATNALTLITTNSSAVALDFASGTPRYRMDQIHASLAVNPTNIVDGREIVLRIHNTSGATRTVTINTNGWSGAIFWNAFPARSGNVVNLTNNSILDISFVPSNGAMLPVGGLLQ